MEQVRLTDICNPKQWKTIPTSDLLDKGFPVYGANGIIGYYSEYNHESPVIAITCRGATCGAINITMPHAYITGNAMCLDDVRHGIDIKYLYYCLLQYDFSKVISGSAQPQITRQGLEKVNLRIGTPTEQQMIIAVLDRVKALIVDRQRQLTALDTLIKARFVEMFGDCDKLVLAGTIMSDMRNGISPSTSGQHHEKVLTLSAITQGKFDSSMWKEGVFDIVPPSEKRISINDFYMCRGNGNKKLVGTGAYSSENRKDLVFPDTVIAAHIDTTRICLPYLSVAWMQPNVRDQIEAGARTTNGTYKINQQVVSKITIPIPPLDQQNQFADFVSQVDKSKAVVQAALDKAQLLFDSLMQQYFG